MAKLTPMTEQFQHFLDEVKEDFWGDVYSKTKLAWKRYFETESQRQRDRYCGFGWYERGGQRKREYRNGYYERDFVTRFGTLRLRIARSRNKNFLPKGLQWFQRRADEVTLLIREAFLRGISTRTVGRIVAIMTGEVVSAQTVSQLTRALDEAVQRFHRARLSDEWKTLFFAVFALVYRGSGHVQVGSSVGEMDFDVQYPRIWFTRWGWVCTGVGPRAGCPPGSIARRALESFPDSRGLLPPPGFREGSSRTAAASGSRSVATLSGSCGSRGSDLSSGRPCSASGRGAVRFPASGPLCDWRRPALPQRFAPLAVGPAAKQGSIRATRAPTKVPTGMPSRFHFRSHARLFGAWRC